MLGVGKPSESELMCLWRARLWKGLIPICQVLEDDPVEYEILPGTTKQERYRQRLIAEGRCPHCGKPCTPFAECEERRAYKQAKAKNKTLVHKASGRPGDKRLLPKPKADYDYRIVVANAWEGK